LPWPKDSKGRAVESVEWYRAVYQVDSGSQKQTRGILALGAISRNLFHLTLARPSGELIPGKPLAVQVFASNPVTQAPAAGVQIAATLELDLGNKKHQALLRSAATNRSGEARLEISIPDILGVSATLKLRGTLRGAGGALATSTLESEFDALSRARILIQKDKPLYQPGQTVHLRVVVLDGRGHAAANSRLTLSISDRDNKKVLAEPLTTNRFGIASYDWTLSKQTETGKYGVTIEPAVESPLDSGDQESILVERYDLPEFTVSALLDRAYFLVGQAPDLKIHAQYLFGKPVSGGFVRVVRDEDSHWNPKTRKMETNKDAGVRAVLDKDGNATLHPDIKGEFEDFADANYLRYRDLTYRAYVTDPTTGKTEPRKFSVRVSHQPIHIYLREMGGNDREGDFLVTTSYADGVPASCSVTLDAVEKGVAGGRIASVQTSHYGLGKVHLRYPEGADGQKRLDVRLTARDAKGLTGEFDDEIYSYSNASSIWITGEKSLLAPKEDIIAKVHGPRGTSVEVDAIGKEGTLSHEELVLNAGGASVTIPADFRFHGEVTLVAYSMRDVGPGQQPYGSGGTRTVLYPQDTALKLKLTGLEKTYPPYAEVHGALRLSDSGTSRLPGAIGIAVTDTAVDERARTEEDFNEQYSGWGLWYSNDDQVGGFTLDGLNRVDMSRPVPEGLHLVAEAFFNGRGNRGISIESSDASEIRDQYESLMETRLKPLGEAMLASKPERLPAALGAWQGAAQKAKIDDSVFLDAWNTSYRLKIETNVADEVAEFVSAGPDKRFGTSDDFSIEAARQSVFARAGERLAAILSETAKRGEPLPGTREQLLAYGLAHGLDLSSLHDPNGQPFLYQVRIRGRWITASASMHYPGDYAPSGNSGYLIWTSPMLDYFRPIEEKMYAAINSWIATGHGFPETDAQAHSAFVAAGIVFDNLRDPMGQPYTVHAREIVSYTRTERASAGKSLAVSARFVTQHLRTVQVVRPPTPDESAASGEVVVGQVVRPIDEQSGKDLRPEATESGTFRGDTGAIGGTVTDQAAAVIPGAKVVVRDEISEKEISITTDETGSFLVGNLQPDSYTIEVSANGFQMIAFRSVQVRSASLTTVDVELHVGTTAQTVTVNAEAVAPLRTSAGVMMANDRDPTLARTFRTPSGKGKVTEQNFTPRIRHVFEETAYWQPSLETDSTGHALFSFRLPDSLTTWKLSAFASTLDGRMQEIDGNLVSFQPFFIDLDTPQVLTAGDELTLPVTLRNYMAAAVTLPVTLGAASWLQPMSATTVRATVPSGEAASVSFGFRTSSIADAGPLRITAANRTGGDAVERTVRVHADGEPQELSSTALLRDQTSTLQLDIPSSAIAGSVQARLRIYPNLASHIIESMDALVQQPHGCGEQTISSTYPSLLLLKLLQVSGGNSAKAGVAREYLQRGFDQLLDYFDESGGLTYWGGYDHHPDATLTAYGIEFLSDASAFLPVKQSRIQAARSWLFSEQEKDGGWKPHYGDASPRDTLYVALVLARSLPADASPEDRQRTWRAVERASRWAQASVTAVHDAFVNALRLRLAFLQRDPGQQEAITAELMSTMTEDRAGRRWSSGGSFPFNIRGRSADLETTALAIRAMGETNLSAENRKGLDGPVLYLIDNQDAAGVWYSGQATVQVLKALLPFAAEQMKAGQAMRSVQIAVNGASISGSALSIDERLLDAPITVDLTGYLRPGANRVTLTSSTASPLGSAQLATSFYVPWQQREGTGTTVGRDYGLDFSYRCEQRDAQAGVPIECRVHERRFGSAGFGMLLAEVGLPPGADVDREVLAKLLAEGTISRYELQPDRIVFYTWNSNPAGIDFRFRFTPRFAIRAKAALALLYDYYNPDERVTLSPETFVVHAR
jgi:hypothetical protein